jgi:hypothetical protein
MLDSVCVRVCGPAALLAAGPLGLGLSPYKYVYTISYQYNHFIILHGIRLGLGLFFLLSPTSSSHRLPKHQPPPTSSRRSGRDPPGAAPFQRCPLSSAPRPQQLPLIGASARSSPRSAPPPTSVVSLWRARPWRSPLAARARSSASPPTDGPAPPAPCASAVGRWPWPPRRLQPRRHARGSCSRPRSAGGGSHGSRCRPSPSQAASADASLLTGAAFLPHLGAGLRPAAVLAMGSLPLFVGPALRCCRYPGCGRAPPSRTRRRRPSSAHLAAWSPISPVQPAVCNLPLRQRGHACSSRRGLVGTRTAAATGRRGAAGALVPNHRRPFLLSSSRWPSPNCLR